MNRRAKSIAVASILVTMPFSTGAYFKYIPDLTPDIQQDAATGQDFTPATAIPLGAAVDAETASKAQPMDASSAPDQK